MHSKPGLKNTSSVIEMPRMRWRRLALRLSQRDLSRRARVAHSDVCRFETGRGTPYPSQAARLGDVLGLAPEELLQIVKLGEVAS